MGVSKKVVVLMPAYRAGRRLVETFHKIPAEFKRDVIIVDDASPDNTFELARQLPAKVFRNAHNQGYGGNLKICLQKGLETDGDVFVELHGDGQYDPKFIRAAVAALRLTDGMLLGSRLMERGQARRHGMSTVKYVMNIFLTWLANVVLSTRLTEFQSGFRVYTRQFLERAHFQEASNDHLFSLETILQALFHGFTVGEVPVVCTYEDGVTQMRFMKGVKYTLEMVWALFRYRLAKLGWCDRVFR